MKRKFKYLYLDDNEKIMREGDVELLNQSLCLKIDTDYPNSWQKRSVQIFKNLEVYDGLILDWELTNSSEKAKEGCEDAGDVDFSSEAFAEHLRVSAAKKDIKDIPIILCSADKNKKFSSLRMGELTSQDLFDLTYTKKNLFNECVNEAERQLCSLSESYESLRTKKLGIWEILNIDKGKSEFVDLRFIDILDTYLQKKTVHDVIQFMLREFIEKEGILINDAVLAARLGVDIAKSKKSWESILRILNKNDVNYNGLLHHGWTRYWAFALEEWWEKFSPRSLRTMNATNRIEVLNSKFDLDLIASERIKFCSSEEYWTICYGTNLPIDPLNGFMIGQNISYPWQEAQYVSAYAELEKTDKESWKINILDRERYNQFKKVITG